MSKKQKYPHWIATVNFKDGTSLKTEPFYEYDNGFKVWSANFSSLHKNMFNSIECEKIESPKQYHSQEPVDVSRLREQWEQLLLDNDVNTGLQDVLFDFFLPHLSQPKESDAVEFAEWCHLNGWTYNSVSNDWYNTTLQPFKTSDELYHQYLKQLKHGK